MEDVKGYFSDEELLQKCAYKKNRKTTGKDRETGVLADRRYLVAKPEEKVDGVKEHSADTEYDNRSGWKRGSV